MKKHLNAIARGVHDKAGIDAAVQATIESADLKEGGAAWRGPPRLFPRVRPLLLCPGQVFPGKALVPVQAAGVGHGVLVDHLGQRLAQQQLLDGQLLLLAAERARYLGHGKDIVGHKAGRQRRADGLVDALAQRRIQLHAGRRATNSGI
jgi:hypothetical protein